MDKLIIVLYIEIALGLATGLVGLIAIGMYLYEMLNQWWGTRHIKGRRMHW